tara:strand:+ start:938 stop:1240 length:303 start_codon:yes stop_codon:yes gene_type:complete
MLNRVNRLNKLNKLNILNRLNTSRYNKYYNNTAIIYSEHVDDNVKFTISVKTSSICKKCKGSGWIINNNTNNKDKSKLINLAINNIDFILCTNCNGTGIS